MLKEGQNIVILGAGESGTGAALLAQFKGHDVFVSDSGSIKENFKVELTQAGINFEEGGHNTDRILKADLIIKSPGIPEKVALIKTAKEKGIRIISEIEFAGYYTDSKMICITGSNGKTTTTLLTHHILKKAGMDVGLAGNVGFSLARMVAFDPHDYYVVELSSFQLDGMFDFKADIAILLNITPDHLDRYEYQMEKYADSKFRIIQNQTEKDIFIYCADDEVVSRMVKEKIIAAQQFPFSIKQKVERGAFIENEEIHIVTKPNEKPFTMSIQELALQGKHNVYNSMASAIASRTLELRKDSIRESLSDFQNIEHRLEHVAMVHGIEFINDSKATNINSTWYALESMSKQVVLILGGVDKGNDYHMLDEMIKDKVKAIICLGKDNAKIHEAFGGIIENIVDATSADEAVKAAYYLGKKGDVVLLSPACASFDLFENYEDRGRQFKNAVRAL